MSIFGEWTRNVDELLWKFVTAQPFEHVVIPGFFTEEVAQQLATEFPEPRAEKDGGMWHKYDNPIERKFALNDFTGLNMINHVFGEMQKEEFVEIMRCLTDIPDLMADPHLHGAGLHAYPRGGKLDMHLDYSIHPVTGMERRVNLIVYLNKWAQQEGDTEFGGDLRITDDLTADVSEWGRVEPAWNTAVIFRTSDNSYHGIPDPIMCPEGDYRKSMAIYYVSPPRADACFTRRKAEFFPMPDQPLSEQLKRLYEIRKSRRLTDADLME